MITEEAYIARFIGLYPLYILIWHIIIIIITWTYFQTECLLHPLTHTFCESCCSGAQYIEVCTRCDHALKWSSDPKWTTQCYFYAGPYISCSPEEIVDDQHLHPTPKQMWHSRCHGNIHDTWYLLALWYITNFLHLVSLVLVVVGHL